MFRPVVRRTRRRIRRRALQVVVFLLMAAGAWVWWKERIAYRYDTATCRSDNMYVLKISLERYAKEHNGALPATFDELREYVKATGGTEHTYDVCVRAGKPFVWMPAGVETDDGKPVILMCPPNSHGWLRKYAFGLVRDGDTLKFVRIRGNRATPL